MYIIILIGSAYHLKAKNDNKTIFMQYWQRGQKFSHQTTSYLPSA